MLDSAQQPMDDWRYRFGPLQEREQKRQYATAGNAATDGLAWTYTLLGADAKQLATYNGLQGAFCGQPAGTVWMWPVEHNAWGPAGTRIIMRPTGAREYVVHDHLGSARLTYDNTGGVVERRSYRAFGVETQSDGEGARTSYIGREKDNESDLGFHGVRMYEPDYGRFLSVDPLWGLYSSVQPYHYSLNQPLSQIDDGGKWVEAKTPEAQQAVRESLPSCLRSVVTFSDGGILNVGPLVEAAQGADPESNIARLAGLAARSEGIEVHVLGDEDVLDATMYGEDGESRSVGFQFASINKDRPAWSPIVGQSHPGLFQDGLSDMNASVVFSSTENARVVVRATPRGELGVTTAHEFVHLEFLFMIQDGKGKQWRHEQPVNEDSVLEKTIRRAEDEARQ